MKKILFAIILTLGFAHAFAEEQLSQESIKYLELFGNVYDRVKNEYVSEVNDKELVESAINGMLSSLDPHSGYLNQKAFDEMKVQTKGEFGGLGIEVTMENGLVKVISPIDDTPAYHAGIKFGDFIVAINNEPVMGLTLSEAVEKMRGKAGTKIHITIMRDSKNEPIELDLVREIIKIKSVKSRQEAGNITYLRINSFSENTVQSLKDELDKINREISGKPKAIILDLRNNPGGLLDQAVGVTNLFLDGGEIVSTRGRTKDSIVRFNATKGSDFSKVPMVVLINGGSASASEIVAGALQDHKRAVIMGTKSFGKGSVQTVIPLSGNQGAMKLTTARYYTPSGKSIQAEGIIPDVIVEPAKIEFAEQKDNKRLFSEANLKGHLQNDKSKKEQENIEVKKESELKTKDDKSLYEKDFQLARAIDLLKAITIFGTNYSKK